MNSSQLAVQTYLGRPTWRCSAFVSACCNSYSSRTSLLCLSKSCLPGAELRAAPELCWGHTWAGAAAGNLTQILHHPPWYRTPRNSLNFNHCVTETHKGRALSSSLPTSPIPSPGTVLLRGAHLQAGQCVASETNCRGQTPALSPSRSVNLLLEANFPSRVW